METRDIFLCHASKDKDNLASPIYRALIASHISVWFDEAEIGWGEPILEKVQKGLKDAKYFLVILTKNFCHEDGTFRFAELETALDLQIATKRPRILPLLCGITIEEIKQDRPLLGALHAKDIGLFDLDRPLPDDAIRYIVSEVENVVTPKGTETFLTRGEVDNVIGTIEQRIGRAQVCGTELV